MRTRARRAGAARFSATDPRQERLDRLRVQIEAETILVDGSKSKFWAALRQKVAENGFLARARIQGHENMTNEQRAIWLDRFLRYEWFLGLVEKAPRALDKLEQEFAKLKADLEKGAKGGYNG